MSEEHEFQADVRQILRLVTHSIYSDREVFLRELISNASDALDTARFKGLQGTLREVDGEPGIQVSFDAEAKTLTISDDGVGLTAEQAQKNLGTIAQSGTRAFADALKAQAEEGAAPADLIGQFGVGFYSAFMVADKVSVESLSAEPGSEPIRWISDGGSGYSLEPGSKETRGTEITLHLREDSEEYLDEDRLREVIRKHSDFVSWPIELGEERINQEKALWTRNPSEVTEEEYVAFYKHVSGDWREPLVTLHVRAEGPLQFQALLFIPEARPWELDRLDFKVALKLYQKRIKIIDHANDLLPRYLRFVSGVIDSPDVSLNVSREMLQQTAVVQKIKKQLTKRLLKKLRDLAREDGDKYNRFFGEMGHLLKEGVAEDDKNRGLITELLRYKTTTSGGDLRSFAEMKESMKEGQDALWYLTDVDKDNIAGRPVLEAFSSRSWEVALMTDPVDEWVVMQVRDFDETPLKSAAHGELPEDDAELSEEEESERATVMPLAEWMKGLLSSDVAEVRLSNRLTDSPSVLVNQEGAMGANMESILKAANQQVSESKRVLEINPGHPMVKTLARLNGEGKTGLEPFAHLLLDHALITEGRLTDPAGFAGRLQALMEKAADNL